MKPSHNYLKPVVEDEPKHELYFDAKNPLKKGKTTNTTKSAPQTHPTTGSQGGMAVRSTVTAQEDYM